jgi:hypothetical protein
VCVKVMTVTAWMTSTTSICRRRRRLVSTTRSLVWLVVAVVVVVVAVNGFVIPLHIVRDKDCTVVVTKRRQPHADSWLLLPFVPRIYSSSTANNRRAAVFGGVKWSVLLQQSSSQQNGDDEDKNTDSGGSNDDDDTAGLFFDDFADLQWTTGSGNDKDFSSSSASSSIDDSSSSLTNRIRQVQVRQDEQKRARLQNWNDGEWMVRGFSLDTQDAFVKEAARLLQQHGDSDNKIDKNSNNNKNIHVCRIVRDETSRRSRKRSYNNDDENDEDDENEDDEDDDDEAILLRDDDKDADTIWVGRTDGSLLCVALGTEYFAKFQSKLTAAQVSSSKDGGMSVQVSSQLVREDEQQLPIRNDDDDYDDEEVMVPEQDPLLLLAPPTSPFEILFQAPVPPHYYSSSVTTSSMTPPPAVDCILSTRSRLYTSYSFSKTTTTPTPTRGEEQYDDDDDDDQTPPYYDPPGGRSLSGSGGGGGRKPLEAAAGRIDPSLFPPSFPTSITSGTTSSSASSSLLPNIVALLKQGDIQQWKVVETSNENSKERMTAVVPDTILTGVHTQDVICLQRLKVKKNNNRAGVLFSASRDGSLALWDETSGKLLQAHSFRQDNDNDDIAAVDSGGGSGNNNAVVTIASAHACGDYVYLGFASATSGAGGDPSMNGKVWIYSLQNLQFHRVGQWTAYSDASSYVTAIHCAGPSISSSPSSSSPSSKSTAFTVVTGSSSGELKQWLVMERQRPPQDQGQKDDQPVTKLDVWPKLATQRLRKTAHVFRNGGGSGGGASSRQSSVLANTAAITCIQVHGNNDLSSATTTTANDSSSTAPLILSACADGTVQCWNAMTGRRVFLMDGFTSPLHSLCLYQRPNVVDDDDDDDSAPVVVAADNDNLLITDGMQHLVCVHDFGQSIAQQQQANDEDDDFDVDDYLNRF